MLGTINGVELIAVASTVSKDRVSIADRCAHLLTPKKAARLAKGTGFQRLSIAPNEVCTSDLCFNAASEIFDRGLVSREEIGAIVFISQSPDYNVPATAFILQHRLKLPTDIVAFDVNLGCPGFVYGIYLASMLLSSMDRKVLLCCGDAHNRNTWRGDTSMLPLFGDGGSAAIIGRSNERKIFYNIDSYGEGWQALWKPRGGTRAHVITDAEGNLIETVRDNYVIMDGMAIMDFALTETPANIERLVEYAGVERADIDAAFFHQANRMIVESLADKLGLDRSKVPFECTEIGNTSSASIPVCMTELVKRKSFDAFKTSLLSGFGVGLSVASMILDLSQTKVLETFEI